jgi:hypothetical protein
MKRKEGTPGLEESQHIRLAWWASFFATIALIAILGLARSAQAITLPAADPGNAASTLLAFDDEAEDAEEDEEEFNECESEDEAEEEECEAELEAEEAETPRECVLSSVSATVSAATTSNKIRLAIQYTAYSPGAVKVSYFLRGSKGPLSLGVDRDRLAKKGVLRDIDTLHGRQMSKALAARDFTIQLRPADAPRYCNDLLDRHLTIRHNASGRLTWSDPGPAATAARQG